MPLSSILFGTLVATECVWTTNLSQGQLLRPHLHTVQIKNVPLLLMLPAPTLLQPTKINCKVRAKRAVMAKTEWEGNSLNCPFQQSNLQPKGEGKIQITCHLWGVSWGLYLERTIRTFYSLNTAAPYISSTDFLKTLNNSYFRPKKTKLHTQTKMERLKMHFHHLHSRYSFIPHIFLISIQLFVGQWKSEVVAWFTLKINQYCAVTVRKYAVQCQKILESKLYGVNTDKMKKIF